MLHFETIQFLFALIAVALLTALFIGLVYWKRWVRHSMGDARLVQQLLSGYSSRRFNTKIILVLVAITLGILAAANLRSATASKETAGAGVDVMLVLDVSKSMLSQDVPPSRLDKAKQFIHTLLPQLDGNRAGLVLFAGQAYLQMPLTPDLAAARMFVSNAGVDAVPVQGTVVSEALTLANSALDVKEKKYKAVVLITDGEDNDEGAQEAARMLFENGVVVHTVGIGSTEGSNIIEPGTQAPKRDLEGNVIVSRLNESLLQQIAKETRGSYHHLQNAAETASTIATAVNEMEKRGFTVGGSRSYTSYFPWLIALALILLVLEVFIPERKTMPA